MLEKLGEGTFGYPLRLTNISEVWKARRHGSKEIYALKKILMHNEKEGVFPKWFWVLTLVPYYCVTRDQVVEIVESRECDWVDRDGY
jgi:hypothetical protein